MVLLGTAVGDALGMPFETMKADNPKLIEWDGVGFLPSSGHYTYKDMYGKYDQLKAGMYTDDTQMSLCVAKSLIEKGTFDGNDISRRYLEWYESDDCRGIGGSCRQALDKIKSGVHWINSGVKDSLGNGTVMRVAPYGVFFRKDLEHLKGVVKLDSLMTHDSHEAYCGSLAIAHLIAQIINKDYNWATGSKDKLDLVMKVLGILPNCQIRERIQLAIDIAKNFNTSYNSQFIIANGIGTKGSVLNTVPIAIYSFLKFDSYLEAVSSVIKAGGDTDTNAAVTGAIFGAMGFHIRASLVENLENYKMIEELDKRLLNPF